MATYVLVHGGWGGGWVWQHVARLLRAQGHEVFTPTLTGVGERAHLRGLAINLETHILDVVNVIDFEELRDVILVGHSYGGMVITGVADRRCEAIAALVYLDAFVGVDDESVLTLTTPGFRDFLADGASRNGGLYVPPLSPESFNVTLSEQDWFERHSTAHPYACFTQRCVLTGAWERVARKAYLLATGWRDNPFRDTFARLQQDAAWITYTLACGHMVQIDRPAELAAWLTLLA